MKPDSFWSVREESAVWEKKDNKEEASGVVFPVTCFRCCSPSHSATYWPIKHPTVVSSSTERRGELLDSTDQDQNQNPELHRDKPVKREEPDSPSATTTTQVSVYDVMIKRLQKHSTD